MKGKNLVFNPTVVVFLLVTFFCSRMVAEISMEKKHKSQKAKTKTSESRKQLSSVRVIQRNLVYIVGLPLNLADEDVSTLLIPCLPTLFWG